LRYQPKRQRDRQRTAPVHQCAQCGGELYPGGAYWKVNGRIFCESCLVAWTLGQLSCFRHICGEVEE
jgi:hypothetical protein